MMDNASNNDTLMSALEIRCLEAGIDFSASDARLRCMPHTIHLAAIKVFKEFFFFVICFLIYFIILRSC
jgi:hypothetical protein